MVHKFQFALAGKTQDGSFVVEASTLRLPPGVWPETLLAQANTKPLAIFRRTSPILAQREFYGYVYVTGRNEVLTVFND